MTRSLLGIVIAAALFVVYGLVPQRGCTGHCEGCAGGSCDRWRDGEEDHGIRR